MKIAAIVRELLHNFISGPLTVQFPHETIPISERYRGKHAFDIERCVSCGMCARICVSMAIEMVPVRRPDGEEHLYPRIDMTKCCFCRMCEDICPKDALVLTRELPEATFDPTTLILEPASTGEQAHPADAE
ncbi:MAG: 4Fe-4S dicluster domain-containing protein [Armatimonadetes bacterium]|nr:4Fe-4S dicluster domain-containing protein [Armatimonadota bacterium]